MSFMYNGNQWHGILLVGRHHWPMRCGHGARSVCFPQPRCIRQPWLVEAMQEPLTMKRWQRWGVSYMSKLGRMEPEIQYDSIDSLNSTILVLPKHFWPMAAGLEPLELMQVWDSSGFWTCFAFLNLVLKELYFLHLLFQNVSSFEQIPAGTWSRQTI